MSLTNQPNPDKLQFAFRTPDYTDQVVLSANTSTGYSLAAAVAALGTTALLVNIIGETASIAVNFYGDAAAFAVTSTSGGVASSINPGPRQVTSLALAAESIFIISRTSQNVSVEIWTL